MLLNALSLSGDMLDLLNLTKSPLYMCAESCPTLQLYELWLTRLLCPWHFPGKNTGAGCHFLLQGIFPIHGLKLCLLHCRWILYC